MQELNLKIYKYFQSKLDVNEVTYFFKIDDVSNQITINYNNSIGIGEYKTTFFDKINEEIKNGNFLKIINESELSYLIGQIDFQEILKNKKNYKDIIYFLNQINKENAIKILDKIKDEKLVGENVLLRELILGMNKEGFKLNNDLLDYLIKNTDFHNLIVDDISMSPLLISRYQKNGNIDEINYFNLLKKYLKEDKTNFSILLGVCAGGTGDLPEKIIDFLIENIKEDDFLIKNKDDKMAHNLFFENLNKEYFNKKVLYHEKMIKFLLNNFHPLYSLIGSFIYLLFSNNKNYDYLSEKNIINKDFLQKLLERTKTIDISEGFHNLKEFHAIENSNIDKQYKKDFFYFFLDNILGEKNKNYFNDKNDYYNLLNYIIKYSYENKKIDTILKNKIIDNIVNEENKDKKFLAIADLLHLHNKKLVDLTDTDISLLVLNIDLISPLNDENLNNIKNNHKSIMENNLDKIILLLFREVNHEQYNNAYNLVFNKVLQYVEKDIKKESEKENLMKSIITLFFSQILKEEKVILLHENNLKYLYRYKKNMRKYTQEEKEKIYSTLIKNHPDYFLKEGKIIASLFNDVIKEKKSFLDLTLKIKNKIKRLFTKNNNAEKSYILKDENINQSIDLSLIKNLITDKSLNYNNQINNLLEKSILINDIIKENNLKFDNETADINEILKIIKNDIILENKENIIKSFDLINALLNSITDSLEEIKNKNLSSIEIIEKKYNY